MMVIGIIIGSVVILVILLILIAVIAIAIILLRKQRAHQSKGIPQ